MKTLILTKDDIKDLISMDLAIESVRTAYRTYARRRLVQPPITTIEVEEHKGEMDIKSCYSMDDEIISIKMATGFYNNQKDLGLPSLLASLLLLDANSGFPLCIMDASLITGFRTGAAGGLSAELLARKDAKVVSLIGAGNQARMQLRAIKALTAVDTVQVWSPSTEEMEKYKEDMEKELDVEVNISKSPEEAIRGGDIIVTVTPAKSPMVMKEWVKEGAHIIAVGADGPGKQELDIHLFKNANVFVDSLEQCIACGEVRNPIINGIIEQEEITAELGSLLIYEGNGRYSDEEITIFDTTGMGVQDNALATLLYKKAMENNLGKQINLMGV